MLRIDSPFCGNLKAVPPFKPYCTFQYGIQVFIQANCHLCCKHPSPPLNLYYQHRVIMTCHHILIGCPVALQYTPHHVILSFLTTELQSCIHDVKIFADADGKLNKHHILIHSMSKMHLIVKPFNHDASKQNLIIQVSPAIITTSIPLKPYIKVKKDVLWQLNSSTYMEVTHSIK